MRPTRRNFLLAGGAAGLGAGLTACNTAAPAPAAAPADGIAAAIRALTPMTGGVVPIAPAEREARVEKARALMAANRIDALMLEGGSSM